MGRTKGSTNKKRADRTTWHDDKVGALDSNIDPSASLATEKIDIKISNRINKIRAWEAQLDIQQRSLDDLEIKKQQEENQARRIPDLTEEEIRSKYPDLQYPPPNRHPTFVAKWDTFLKNLTTRDNFSEAHLEGLAVLCDSYVQLEEAYDFIKKNGMKYKLSNKGYMLYPEVGLASRLRQEIVRLSTSLGLFPKKDKLTQQPAGKTEEQWS